MLAAGCNNYVFPSSSSQIHAHETTLLVRIALLSKGPSSQLSEWLGIVVFRTRSSSSAASTIKASKGRRRGVKEMAALQIRIRERKVHADFDSHTALSI